MSKTLLVGSSGLLGQHLTLKADRPTHKELDITKKIVPKKYDLIVHAAAYTDVLKAETTDAYKCFQVNVQGTLNLLCTYPTIPFVFISSEYANKPVNFYSQTKAMAETLVKFHPSYLIIRTLFKPSVWEYPKAFVDQFTQGDYVDVIAPLIEKEIEKWDRKGKQMIYVGTGRKSIYDLAIQRNPMVLKMSVNEITGVKLPKDYQ